MKHIIELNKIKDTTVQWQQGVFPNNWVNPITRADTLIAYGATESPSSVKELILDKTAYARHKSRVYATLIAGVTASSQPTDIFWTTFLDMQGRYSQRNGPFSKLGKGRWEASDGPAWMAASQEVIDGCHERSIPHISCSRILDGDLEFELLDEVDRLCPEWTEVLVGDPYDIFEVSYNLSLNDSMDRRFLKENMLLDNLRVMVEKVILGRRGLIDMDDIGFVPHGETSDWEEAHSQVVKEMSMKYSSEKQEHLNSQVLFETGDLISHHLKTKDKDVAYYVRRTEEDAFREWLSH